MRLLLGLFYLAHADIASALSTAALDALKEFYADEEARAKQFEDLKLAAENHSVDNPALTMDAFSENWNESQFWVCRRCRSD